MGSGISEGARCGYIFVRGIVMTSDLTCESVRDSIRREKSPFGMGRWGQRISDKGGHAVTVTKRTPDPGK